MPIRLPQTILLLALLLPQIARAAPPVALFAHGTDELYWIARVDPDPNNPQQLYTTVLERSSGAQRWRTIATIEGKALALSGRRSDAIALLESGQWMLLWLGGGTIGQPLPNSAQILAIAGDESNNIWAIGRGAIGAIESETTSAATSRPSSSPKVQGTALFHWNGQRWRVRAMLDGGAIPFSASPSDLSMVAHAAQVTIAARDHSMRIDVMQFETSLHMIGSVAPAKQFALIDAPTRVMLWTADPGTLTPIESPLQTHLSLPAPAGHAPTDPSVMTSAIGQLRLIFFHENKLMEQTYSGAGQPSGQPAVIVTAPATPIGPVLQSLGMMLLLMLTFFIFAPVRRQTDRNSAVTESVTDDESIDAPRRRRDEPIPAPMLRRVQAAVVDAVPIIVAIFLAVSKLDSGSIEERVDLLPVLELIQWAALAVYLLHTLIAELLTARTLGKWIFGLRVVTTHNQRPGFLSILIRNIARVLEFSLLLPMFVPFFTTLNQRVGDLAAGTVVVSDDVAENDRGNDE